MLLVTSLQVHHLLMWVPPLHPQLLLLVLRVHLLVALQLMFLTHVLLGIEPGQGAQGRSPFQPGSPFGTYFCWNIVVG